MDSVFIKNNDRAPHSYAGLSVVNLLGLTRATGDIGIEIEVEGNKFPKSSGYELGEGDAKRIPKAWKFTDDGSLRGEDNAEYVLAKPLKFDEVEKAVTDLWQMFHDYGSVLSESNRTSVHVHLNVQEWHLNRLCSFVAMYYTMEDLLTTWCGDHRVGNLFCLRATDAPAIIRRLKEFFQQDGVGYKFSSGMHYAGLNPSALHKFGSIEIRSLRGVSDPSVILQWVNVLRRLYELSADFKDPREVVSGFSGSGPIAWLQNILGDTYSSVVENVPFDTNQIRDSLYKGIRLAQDLCYCRDWSQFKEKKLERDPFSRVKSAAIAAPVGFSTTPSWVMAPPPPSAGPIPTDYYYVLDVCTSLQQQGTISDTMYSSLTSVPHESRKNWLISNGYLPSDDQDEDFYEEDEDYYFEEDDD